MASNFTNSFTGKGVAVTLPSGQGLQRAQEGMSDMLVKAEDIKLKAFQKNEEDFLKASHIDPIYLISEKARQAQSEMLEDFNKTYGGLLQKKGILTTQDKNQMASAKDVLIMQQNKLKADMDQAFAAKDAIQKDIKGDLDYEDFNRRWEGFIKTGNWEAGPLLPSPLDIEGYLNRDLNKVHGTPTNVTVPVKVGGVTLRETRQASASEQEARDALKGLLFGNPRIARDAIQKFHNLKDTDPQEYVRRLDTSGDGKLSRSEEGNTSTAEGNPIFEWYTDTYWPKAIKYDMSKPVNLNAGSRGTFNWDLGIGAGHNKNAEYPVQPQVKLNTAYGVFDLPDMISLGVASQTTEQQQIPEMIEIKDGKEVITQINDAARFNIISYSPSKDVIFVKILDDGETVEQDEVIALPAARYDSLLKKKPFGIDRASLVKNQLSQPVKTKPKLY